MKWNDIQMNTEHNNNWDQGNIRSKKHMLQYGKREEILLSILRQKEKHQ